MGDLRTHEEDGLRSVVVGRREHPLPRFSPRRAPDVVESLVWTAHEQRAEWFRWLFGMAEGDRPDAATHNEATGGHNVVQAGAIHGGVHFHESDPVHDEPVIVTVDVPSSSGFFVVDGDPEGLVALSDHSGITVTVEGHSARAVVLRDLKPVVRARREPRLAVRIRPRESHAMIVSVRPIEVDLTADELRLKAEDLYFNADLRDDDPHMTAQGISYRSNGGNVPVLPRGGFPYAVTASEPEHFYVRPSVVGHEVDWVLHLEWLHAGRRGTTIVDDGGRPFQLYPGGRHIPDEYETAHDPRFRELRRRLPDDQE